ncbi:heme exporter protein CcmD [Thiorhodococcus minor]|uniref:Heme exporter protein D n=1 Tax=Thiorhodococcus minor TaxID=57489 RepID=A0A6M0K0W3_9GAMM|nr:heme exporter protein CcmD [Thiorhodococcus minor]NEV62944.1 heme exporter protein CcmD [Thiorhodococcus minor]
MSEFFSQGGFAFFVWGAYGMVAALLVIEILQLRAQRRTLLARLGRLSRMRDTGATE